VKITTTSSYDDPTLASLHWTEALTSDQAGETSCGSDMQAPTTAPAGIDVAIDANACPTAAPDPGGNAPTFTLTITYTDPTTGDTHTYTAVVTGTPPN
jgi:hypothetical protein